MSFKDPVIYARPAPALFALLLLFMAAACAGAQETPPDRYGSVARSVDGIGKTYEGREIASIMGWQGAAWLERDEREREERSSLLLRELRLEPGMMVADIGAGTGYYSRRIAPRVGPDGQVFAVEVQPQLLNMLKQTAARPEYANLVPVQGTATDPELAPESIDLALMVDVYHELEFPYEMLVAIVDALKPDGRVVFVEYRAEDASVPIKALHKMSEQQIRREAANVPLQWVRTADTLPWQHVVVFRKAADAMSVDEPAVAE